MYWILSASQLQIYLEPVSFDIGVFIVTCSIFENSIQTEGIVDTMVIPSIESFRHGGKVGISQDTVEIWVPSHMNQGSMYHMQVFCWDGHHPACADTI